MEWLTVEEAAAELGLSKIRAYQLVQSGALPAEKLGRQYAIHPDVLRAFKKRKRRAGRPTSYVVLHGKRSWDVTAQSAAEAREKVLQELGPDAPPRSDLKVTRRRRPKEK
jgi:excisionase family DNA binding protein